MAGVERIELPTKVLETPIIPFNYTSIFQEQINNIIFRTFFQEKTYNILVKNMSIVAYNTKELDLLARLMRAEALGEGDLGMLMVGNVGINRVIANCIDFRNLRSITDMVYQSPGGFSSINSALFNSSPTTKEKRLAKRVIDGETFYPATNALWFYAPGSGNPCRSTWYNQENSGKYKNHCFYRPSQGKCPRLY